MKQIKTGAKDFMIEWGEWVIFMIEFLKGK
jgi:hypothetical protein